MSKSSSKIEKKCVGCGKSIRSHHSKFCPICSHFSWRLSQKRLLDSTVKDVWDYVCKYGYVCYYTGMSLDMSDPTSPWYGVLDHWIPHNNNKIVLTSALLNDMKSDLTEGELWYYIFQLYNHKKKWSKVRKRPLVYFNRLSQYIKIRGKKCVICGKRVVSNHSKYCRTCFRFAHRLKHYGYASYSWAVKDLWRFIRKNGYICYYTGMSLDMVDTKSPWYGVIDHWIPGNGRKLVLTSSLINDMKSDLTESEFWYFIEELYNYKKKHIKVRKKNLLYWNRLTPSRH